MKFSCTQENLNQGLFAVSHVAGKNTNLPILNNILIQAKEGGVLLTATNLEIGVSSFVRSKNEEMGECAIPSKLFSDYITLLPKEKVDIEKNNNDLAISCGGYKTKIRGLEASEFPVIPQIKKENPILADAKEFQESLSQVVFCVSTHETRPEIGGVLFRVREEKELVLAATDSYRLAEKHIPLQSAPSGDKKFIVPGRTAQEFLRILSGLTKDGSENKNSDTVELYFGENQILFVYKNTELVSRLIEGQYPDYEQIIPKEHKTAAKVSVGAFIKAVKTASIFSRSGIYDIRLKLDPNKGMITVSSENNQLGENVSEVEAHIEGDENDIVLNYRFLLDGLQGIHSEEAEILLNTPDSPCIVRGAEEKNHLYIIMPIKQ